MDHVLPREHFALASMGGHFRTYSADTAEPLEATLAPEFWAHVGRSVKEGDRIDLACGPKGARVYATAVIVGKLAVHNDCAVGLELAILGRSDAPVPAPAKKRAA